MNLNDFDLQAKADQGVEVPLRHPHTNEPLGDAVVVVAGQDSKRYRMARAEQARKLQGRDEPMTPEEADAVGVEFMAALCLGWRGIELDGKPYSYTPDNARHLFDRYRWISDQCVAKLPDRSSFFVEPSSS